MFPLVRPDAPYESCRLPPLSDYLRRMPERHAGASCRALQARLHALGENIGELVLGVHLDQLKVTILNVRAQCASKSQCA